MTEPAKSEYLSLMRQLTRDEIGVREFVGEFFTLRRRANAALDALRASWPRRYDVDLISALSRGEITKAEFSDRYFALWPMPGGVAFQRAVDEIFSAADMVGNADSSSETADADLRDVVARVLREHGSADETDNGR